MSDPRRHHFVQKAYLDRFADGGQVYVRRRDGKSFTSGTRNVAVETGFYDISDASGERSTAVEQHLATTESAAIAAIRRIDEAGQPPAPGTSHREDLARYLALQSTRTPETRERIFFARRLAQYAGDRGITRELVAEYLEKVHLGFRPSQNEASAAFDFVEENLKAPETLTPEFAIQVMLDSVERIAPILHGGGRSNRIARLALSRQTLR